jgi:serine/threonine protein kinase
MKGGKGIKDDVKQWVLKRTKSSGTDGKSALSEAAANNTVTISTSENVSAKGGDNISGLCVSSLESKLQVDMMMNSPTSIQAPPPKVTFSAKGTDFRVDPRYTFIKALGLGAYGIVCSAGDSVEQTNVAIKKVTGVFDDQTDAKRIIREIRLLCSMQHENILRITDIDEPESYATFNDVYIMTELMDTDLNKLLRSKHPLLDAQRKFFTYQIFRALKYIHSANILHRDLKPANVLVSENCDLKICDFGLARYVDPAEGPAQAMTEYVVTRWYRAPELLLAGEEYTAAIDMWSAGCLLAELYTRKPIFPGRDVKNQIEVVSSVVGKPTREQIQNIPNRRAREFIAGLPDDKGIGLISVMKDACPEAIDLVTKLLQFDPNDRLTASQALEHPYVAEFRDEESETTAHSSLILESLEPPNEKKLGREGVRRLMWDEMLKFHPSARLREPASAAIAEKKVQSVNAAAAAASIAMLR